MNFRTLSSMKTNERHDHRSQYGEYFCNLS